MNPPDTTSSDDSTAGRPSTRLFAVLAPAVVPWSFQWYTTGGATLVFAWGLVTTDPVHFTTLFNFLFRYTRGLPPFILAWPLGVGCYLVAVISAGTGRVTGFEDVRLTAAALALAGLTQLELARGFSVQPGRTAWPVGTVVLWAVAGYVYWSGRSDGR